jgi:acyl-coenzyme A synthetase/AMP-(fatty) acid ligase
MIDTFASVHTPSNPVCETVLVYKGDTGIEFHPGALTGIKGASLDEVLAKADHRNPPSEWRVGASLDDVLWYIYTSGTTGLPKAAKVTNK